MNKVILAVLLVCFISVSVDAFVKRDAPVAAPASASGNNQLEEIMKQFTSSIQELQKTASEKIQQNFNSDKLKEDFEKITAQLNEGLKQLTSPKGSPPASA